MVGRKAELDAALAAWREAAHGRGAVLVIEGPAGIGKSRLLHEIRRSTRPARARMLVFQCSPGGDRTALHPLMNALIDAEPGRSGRLTTAILAARFSRQGIVDGEALETFAWLLGAGTAPAEEPYVMLSQIATAYYFLHFLVILPIVSMIERPEPLPFSITEAVLGSDKKAVLGENTSPAT